MSFVNFSISSDETIRGLQNVMSPIKNLGIVLNGDADINYEYLAAVISSSNKLLAVKFSAPFTSDGKHALEECIDRVVDKINTKNIALSWKGHQPKCKRCKQPKESDTYANIVTWNRVNAQCKVLSLYGGYIVDEWLTSVAEKVKEVRLFQTYVVDNGDYKFPKNVKKDDKSVVVPSAQADDCLNNDVRPCDCE